MNEKYLILDSMVDEIIIFSKDHKILFINKAMSNFLGEKEFSELICEEFKSKVTMCKDVISGVFVDKEVKLFGDNQYRSMSVIVMEDESILVKFHNITLLKLAQAELEKTKIKYAASESLAKLGHWEFDIINNELHWSDEIYKMFNIDKNLFEATYESFLNVIHPEDRELVNNKYMESLKTKEPYDVIHRLKLNDGFEKYVHEKCITEFSADGIPLKSFGLVWDISDLVKNKMALKTSEEKLRKFLDATLQSIIITDKNTVIVDSTYRENSHFGYTHDEIIGKKFSIFYVSHETYLKYGYDSEHYEKLKADIWPSIQNPSIGEWSGVILSKDKYSKVLWLELGVKTIFDDNDEVLYYIINQHDVSQYYQKDIGDKVAFYNSIARMAEIRDNVTGKHMKRVGIFSKIIAKKMGFSNSETDLLESFAPMHDIGKIGVPDVILNAKRKLTYDEFESIKKHTLIGHDIISTHDDLKVASEIVLSHHERWDGTGYPYGTSGEDIPINARIVSVADVYDALRSERPYKKAWSHKESIKEIVSQSGKMFDPKIVEVVKIVENDLNDVFEQLN